MHIYRYPLLGSFALLISLLHSGYSSAPNLPWRNDFYIVFHGDKNQLPAAALLALRDSLYKLGRRLSFIVGVAVVVFAAVVVALHFVHWQQCATKLA